MAAIARRCGAHFFVPACVDAPPETGLRVSSNRQRFFDSSHLAGGNADYAETLYEQFLESPESVPVDWRRYFDALPDGPRDIAHGPIQAAFAERVSGQRSSGPATSAVDAKQTAVARLITAYRSRGHLSASLDPLGLTIPPPAADLELAFHGLAESDLDTEFDTGSLGAPPRLSLRAILELLKATYSETIGAEFMHIADTAQRLWMHQRLEKVAGNFGLAKEEKLRALERLTAAEGLERYLHTKYVGQKRFSLEGGDSLIPLMDTLLQRAGADGVKEIVIGMAHRGRLNVLINTLGKAPSLLFNEFEGKYDHPEDPAHSGDVKYHMGFSSDIATAGGPLHLALGFNPSHLEIIDPVVTGSVRARQTRRRDTARRQVMPVLIHGDAAFAGQGVVMELLQMSQARGFTVGGTVHIVVNNQVGFTISRLDDARSTLYCTDVAKMISAPVLHVNGDDPEAVLFCAQLAHDFRHTFKRDVVIDLVCYRRHGHNEADEPAATQPLMYQNIRARKSTRELYAERLLADGTIAADTAQRLVDAYRAKLDAGDSVADLAQAEPGPPSWGWSAYVAGTLSSPSDTGVPADKLATLAQAICKVPEDFKLQSRVAKVYEDRAKMAAGEQPMDWGFAENLAYASLLADNFKLRLVGQDTGRGTFFHRHAVLHDQTTGRTVLPLAALAPHPDDLEIIDSLLSEEAVMAFEYGFATTDPNTLVIWEAQFGDFCNGAQVVIDQFLSSGESKWGRLSTLTLFLPHGYEGQGPEHSSARLERFLQLCALENMQVVAPTTPAQMFHLIRRQMVRATRKPLVVMTPKSMLRHKSSVSPLADLMTGSFQNMIADTNARGAKKVKRAVLCSGKVYWDLFEAAQSGGVEDVALIRVEQLYPFPRDAVRGEIERLGSPRDIVWCQEEPMNQGAWYQVQHHIRACMTSGQSLYYAGRARSPAPAAGHFATHNAEQAALVEQALSAEFDPTPVVE